MAKIHDRFSLISLFVSVFITRITERLYIDFRLNEDLSMFNFQKKLIFVAFHSKNVTTD